MNRVEKTIGVKFTITAFGVTSYVPVLGGHTNFTFAPSVDVGETVRAGKLRYLVNSGDTRSQATPAQ
jgi:hypothetical protein